MTTPAQAAEDWLTLPTTAGNLAFAIDQNSLEKSGNLVRFWEKITYTGDMPTDEASGKPIKEKKIRRIMNCADRTQGLLHGVTYGENGRFITSITLEEAQTSMTPIPPNTVASAEFVLVCPVPETTAGKTQP